MNNHYHLYLRTEEANLSHVMKFIGQSFSKYFLRKYAVLKKSGRTFMSPYGRKIVQDEVYSSKLISYIHLNPYKDCFVKHPKDYFWSSYNQYAEDRSIFSLIDHTAMNKFFFKFPENMKVVTTEAREHLEWDPEKNTFKGKFIGDQKFVEKLIGKKIKTNEHNKIQLIHSSIRSEDMIRNSIEKLKLSKDLKKKVLIYSLLEWSEVRTMDLAEEFSLSCSSIRSIKSRAASALGTGHEFEVELLRLVEDLNLY
jgi:hypothetical protein